MITVVTCDIVGSSKYPAATRAQMQEHLLKAWESVKAKFSAKLDSDLGLRITAGDEFQFVCKDIKAALDCVTFLRIKCRMLAVKPLFTFRASLGVGERTVNGDSNPYAQDGPAFHLARKGMEELKKSNQLTAIHCAKPKDAVTTANVLLMLMDTVYENWTVAQVRVIEKSLEGLSGEEIAHEAEISPAAVSKHLTAAQIDSYIVALKELKRIL